MGQGSNQGPTFSLFTRVDQGSNQGPTFRYLLAWTKVRTKGLPGGIYWLGQGVNQVPTLKYLFVVVIYSRGPRFEPKKRAYLAVFTSSGPKFEPKAYRILRYLLAACSRFQPMAYLTLRYLLALLTWQRYTPILGNVRQTHTHPNHYITTSHKAISNTSDMAVSSDKIVTCKSSIECFAGRMRDSATECLRPRISVFSLSNEVERFRALK
jgi:hypothetical protein